MSLPHSHFGTLITPDYMRAFAAYNAEMNRRIYAAAERLPDAARRQQRGAFWGSIHGTLCHLLWGDQIWMARFDGWTKPTVAQKDSAGLIADFDTLARERASADAHISAWAGHRAAWLAQEMAWFSGSAGRQVSKSHGLLVMHFFNHQTHHRGQVHAMITAAGEKTGDTDLFLVI